MADEAVASSKLGGKTTAGARARPAAYRRPAARIAFVLLFVMLTLSGAVMAVSVLGRSRYAWHGFEVEVRLLPDSVGQTRLVLTPLGEVRAHTHAAPITLVASLEALNIEEIQKLIRSTPTREMLAHDLERVARRDLNDFITHQLLMAGLGGLLAPVLLRSRHLWAYALSGLLGMLLVGGTLGSALTTFNGKAFESPTYSGTLKEAPWVIQFGKDAFTKIEALSQKLVTVANNLNVLYGRIAALPDRLAPEDNAHAFRILHVSDLHNNLAALDFIHEVANQFHIDMIVDTGDLTDFGSPPETLMVRGIAKLPYPYVFVLGNHDSRTVAAALAKLPNVTLLNGQVVTVKGIRLLGLPNPASDRAGPGSVDTTPAELQAGGEALLRTVVNLPQPPDIVAIHDPEESRPLWGRVPLILCGHEHRLYLEYHTGPVSGEMPTAPPGAAVRAADASAPPGMTSAYTTILCNAGTTGAAGLRYFEKEAGVPFSCAVLTFDRATVPDANAPTDTASPSADSEQTVSAKRPQLRAIDLIKLDGNLREYSISHQTFNAPSVTVPPTPLPTPPAAASPSGP
ncbi:MAG TPA: metallophosphoesterase [Chthonomonadaceae bacterium]|nr:metallophosphoesterase [Chthonomonadaceae bacterium]